MALNPAPIIVVLFHPYEFFKALARPLTIDTLLGLLRWVRRQNNVAALTIRDLWSRSDDLGAERLRQFQAMRSGWISRLLPAPANPTAPDREPTPLGDQASGHVDNANAGSILGLANDEKTVGVNRRAIAHIQRAHPATAHFKVGAVDDPESSGGQ